MIFPTHVLVGGFVGAVISAFVAVNPLPIVFMGMVAALLPNLDLFMEHRKTLHRPFQYAVVSIVLLGLVAFRPHPGVVALATVFTSLALHSWLKSLTEGQGLREDAMDAERAVYDHIRDQWMSARELTPMGGIPDVVIGLSAGFLAITFAPESAVLIVPVMAVSVVFAATRKRIVTRIPDRFTTLSEFVTHAGRDVVKRVASRNGDSTE